MYKGNKSYFLHYMFLQSWPPSFISDQHYGQSLLAGPNLKLFLGSSFQRSKDGRFAFSKVCLLQNKETGAATRATNDLVKRIAGGHPLLRFSGGGAGKASEQGRRARTLALVRIPSFLVLDSQVKGMAAVLRSAARRLAGELPAAEMGLHRLPFPRHSQVSVWSASSGRSLLPSGPAPSSLSKAKPAMESAICPPFIPRRTMSTCFGRAASQPLDKTKAAMKSTLLPRLIPCRTMSAPSGRAASQPADKFWLEIVGHRMKGPQNPCPMVFRRRISGVDVNQAETIFMDVMMKVKYDGNIPRNMMSSPIRALLRKALMQYMKLKWFIKESALALKIRLFFKLGKLNFVVICVLLYFTYGRPLSLSRRFWKILNSKGGNDSEESG